MPHSTQPDEAAAGYQAWKDALAGRRPNNLVVLGMFRSGSTWAFNVALALLKAKLPGTKIFHAFAEGPSFDRALAKGTRREQVLKCHGWTKALGGALRSGRVTLVIHTCRDPLMALASCVEQFTNHPTFAHDWPFERAVDRIVQGLIIRRRLRAFPNCVVFDLHNDGEEQALALLVEAIHPDVSEETRVHIQNAFRFGRMKKISRQLADRDAGDLLRGINDPRTLMHGNHVARGTERRWTDVLTAEQVAYARKAFEQVAG
ncbi:MAG: hypothetical protein ACFE0O_02395 [Opitutales bacterium]